MSKLKVLNAKAFEKLLLQLGFIKIRQKGSHVFYKHPDGRYTTLPHHRGKIISYSLTKQILREIKITIEDYNALLNKRQ